MSFSLEQLVIDNEIIGMTRYAKLNGIKVNDETLALDAIDEVAAGGDFLGHPTTLANVELPSHTSILDRQMYGAWNADGRKSTEDLAHEVVETALKNPPRFPMPEEQIKAIDAIIERKAQELSEAN